MRRVFAATVLSLIGAALFGAMDAVLWRHQTGMQFWIANVSSTYLLLAFVTGWAVGARGARVATAACVGLSATLVALAAFYRVEVAAFHLAVANAQTDAARYVVGGLITGPMFGALGGLWARRRSWYAIGALGTAFLLEPRAWDRWFGRTVMPSSIAHAETTIGMTVMVLGIGSILRHHIRQP